MFWFPLRKLLFVGGKFFLALGGEMLIISLPHQRGHQSKGVLVVAKMEDIPRGDLLLNPETLCEHPHNRAWWSLPLSLAIFI